MLFVFFPEGGGRFVRRFDDFLMKHTDCRRLNAKDRTKKQHAI